MSPTSTRRRPRNTDSRLVGRWVRTRFSSSGGFSLSTYLFRVFDADGRFADFTRTSMNHNHADSQGNWSGTTSARSGVAPGDRGRWRTKDSKLYLFWDDSKVSELDYQFSGARLAFFVGEKVFIYSPA